MPQRVPPGRAVWRKSRARRLLGCLRALDHQCGTLGEIAAHLNWPADDVLHHLKPLQAAGLVLQWDIHEGEGPRRKRVAIGISLVSDPNVSDRVTHGEADATPRLVTETGGGFLPLDAWEDVVSTGDLMRQEPFPETVYHRPPPQAELDRRTLRDWLATPGAFTALGREAVVPQGVPYPTLLIGEGQDWHRTARWCVTPEEAERLAAEHAWHDKPAANPFPSGSDLHAAYARSYERARKGDQATCPRGHGRHVRYRSHYCLTCQRYGAGGDLVGATPLQERPTRKFVRKYDPPADKEGKPLGGGLGSKVKRRKERAA